MPQPTKGPRLGGGPAHERLILANLATALFQHGRITTTEAKAKRLRPYAEKLITKAKKGDLHNRRQVMRVLKGSPRLNEGKEHLAKTVGHILFTEIAPRYENRPGGYTRITKIGPRKGDNAPMAVIELVEELAVAREAEGATRRAVKEAETKVAVTKPAPAVEEAAVEEAPVEEAAVEEAAVDEAAVEEAAVEETDGTDDAEKDADKS